MEDDKIFGSKWVLTELNRLRFSISHDEVTRYKLLSVMKTLVISLIQTFLVLSISCLLIT